MSDAPIRVVLADDQGLFRSGLNLIVDSQEDMAVVGEARDGGEALAVIDATRPDIVLMDLSMAPTSGLDALKRLSESVNNGKPSPGPRVIMLTAQEPDGRSLEAIGYGAAGILLKRSTPAFVCEAVRTVHAGDTVLTSRDLNALLNAYAEPVRPVPAEFARLTARERMVFAAVARGASNAEIADELCLVESTVKTHIGGILRKLGLRDRIQVVTYSYENGLRRRSPQRLVALDPRKRSGVPSAS